MKYIYLGLGSNLDNPQRHVLKALVDLKGLPKTSIISHTPVIQTSPWGGVKAQPAYYNCIVALKTALTPEQVLIYCQTIEKNHGRVRKVKWGSRTLDIDILLFKNLTRNTQDLKIPHPYIPYREFIYTPLFELINTLEPNFTYPPA